MSDGKFNERQIAAQIEFLQNVGAVRVNRAVADEKLCADFPAGFVFGDQFQDAAFGRREEVESGFFVF